jgi:hypothetical protein
MLDPLKPGYGLSRKQTAVTLVVILGLLWITNHKSGGGNGVSSSAFPNRATTLNAHINESEKKNFAEDPNSMGFSNPDRQFLREHGVSETEARAVEEVTRKHNGSN